MVGLQFVSVSWLRVLRYYPYCDFLDGVILFHYGVEFVVPGEGDTCFFANFLVATVLDSVDDEIVFSVSFWPALPSVYQTG